MVEDINSQEYWKRRLQLAPRGREHEAVFRCSKERWQKIEEKHREILAKHIKEQDSILDCACGWGRLLLMLPPTWYGLYLGVDLSQDFIYKALTDTVPELRKSPYAETNRAGAFQVCDLRELSKKVFLPGKQKWSWAVMVSVRPMVIRNLGKQEWGKMEYQIRLCADKLLYLEYDPDCDGFVE